MRRRSFIKGVLAAGTISVIPASLSGGPTKRLVSSWMVPSAELPAPAWLAANRQSWGIENGNHLRLDVSLQDDRCCVRVPSACEFGV